MPVKARDALSSGGMGLQKILGVLLNGGLVSFLPCLVPYLHQRGLRDVLCFGLYLIPCYLFSSAGCSSLGTGSHFIWLLSLSLSLFFFLLVLLASWHCKMLQQHCSLL